MNVGCHSTDKTPTSRRRGCDRLNLKLPTIHVGAVSLMETRLRYSQVSRRWTKTRYSMFQANSSKHVSKYAKFHVLSRGLEVAESILV